MIEGLVLRLTVFNIANRRVSRVRQVFDPNRILDTAPQFEDRERRVGRFLQFARQGTF
ncbi:MAG: hypothetical protein ACFBZ9_01645 [Sphingomonadales bacterium]